MEIVDGNIDKDMMDIVVTDTTDRKRHEDREREPCVEMALAGRERKAEGARGESVCAEEKSTDKEEREKAAKTRKSQR
jgi:hypothetical protein